MSGGGISNDPTGKEYIGFAYNKTTATESNTPSEYTWSKILGDQGDQGVQGDPGANGETYYTWIKYSDNPDGTGLYDTPTANTLYIGISVNNTSQTESSNKTDYVWSRFRGEDGADGEKGAAIVNRGIFDETKLYYNNSERRDVVKYNSSYYIYKGTNGVALAWSSSNWDSFGAEFESVATNLLLSENANIADWIIKNGKITSQNEYNGNPRAQLNGELGQMTLRSPKTTHTATAGTRTYEQTVEVDSVEGRVRSHRSGDSFQESAEAILDSDGLSVDYAGLHVNDPTVRTLKAAIAANVRGKMAASAYGYTNPLVAVYGRAENTDPNPGIAFGGYFYNLMAKGLFLNGFPRNGNYTVTDNDVYIPMELTVSGNVYLPSNPVIGRTLFVKNVNNFSCTIHGNGHNIKRQSSTSTININYGEMAVLWFDSSKWLCVLLL